MSDSSVLRELRIKVEKLPLETQKRILDMVDNLSKPDLRGITREELSRFAGCISSEDALLMTEAIEEGCERIDLREWSH